MPQAQGILIKHLIAPDSGALDKVYGIDWNNLDDVLRGALASKIEHLGQLRIADDTIVIDTNRDIVGVRRVAQDLDPDAPATRDLGDSTNYWDDAYIQDVYTSGVHFGESDFSPIDVELYRGSANVLALASGDSFNIVNGNFMIGGTILLTSAKKMQNIVSIIQDLDPDAPDTYDLGDSTNYWRNLYAKTVYSDTINERTSDVGVEIDGVLLQDTEIVADRIWFDKVFQDVNLYRGGADVLKSDDELDVAGLYIQGCRCITSNCTASNLGFPYKEDSGFSDSDFDCVKDGLIGIEGTIGAEKIWFRAHGAWHSISA